MAADRKHDDPLAGLLNRSVRSLAFVRDRQGLDSSTRDCPEAEILAAYFDRSLTAAETTRWELHFSACTRCQEQLAALARLETAGKPVSEEAASGFGWLWRIRWLAPAAAALAILTVWVVIRPDGIVRPGGESPSLQARNEQPPAAGAALETAARGKESQSAQPGKGASAREADGKLLAHQVGEKGRAGTSQISADKASAEPRTMTAAAPGPPASTAQRAAADEFKDADRAIALHENVPQRPAEKLEKGALAQRAELMDRRDAQKKVPAAEMEQPSTKTDQIQVAQKQAPPAAAAQETQVGAFAASSEKQKVAQDKAQVAGAVAASETAPKREESLRRASGLTQMAPGFRANEGVILTPQQGTMWRVGADGKIERSTDSGATWQQQQSGVKTLLVAGAAPSEIVCWIVGQSGTVLRTTDGKTWEKLASPTSANLVGVRATDAQNAVVTAEDGKSFTTADGGRRWAAASPAAERPR